MNAPAHALPDIHPAPAPDWLSPLYSQPTPLTDVLVMWSEFEGEDYTVDVAYRKPDGRWILSGSDPELIIMPAGWLPLPKTPPRPVHWPAPPATQNTHILDLLDTAWAAADALARDGYTVLSVTVAGSRPVICIQHCDLCNQLHGSWFRREPGTDGVTVTWQADVLGAQVQWQTRGVQ